MKIFLGMPSYSIEFWKKTERIHWLLEAQKVLRLLGVSIYKFYTILNSVSKKIILMSFEFCGLGHGHRRSLVGDHDQAHKTQMTWYRL